MILLVFVGSIAFWVGVVWIEWKAWKISAWGIFCIFPPVAFVYGMIHSRELIVPICLMMAGFGMSCVGIYGIAGLQ